MTSGLARLNAMPQRQAEAELLTCCGSREWAWRMAAMRPFRTEPILFDAAHEVWWSLDTEAWLEAFRSHPRIGERKAQAEQAEQTEREHAWSRGEQAGMDAAPADTRAAILELNQRYEERFGHIYLVCASGMTAEELLENLEQRLRNSPEAEIVIAAQEQAKITWTRLEKLLETLERGVVGS
jgi:OHCU decarboxylase